MPFTQFFLSNPPSHAPACYLIPVLALTVLGSLVIASITVILVFRTVDSIKRSSDESAMRAWSTAVSSMTDMHKSITESMSDAFKQALDAVQGPVVVERQPQTFDDPDPTQFQWDYDPTDDRLPDHQWLDQVVGEEANPERAVMVPPGTTLGGFNADH